MFGELANELGNLANEFNQVMAQQPQPQGPQFDVDSVNIVSAQLSGVSGLQNTPHMAVEPIPGLTDMPYTQAATLQFNNDLDQTMKMNGF